MQTTHYIPESAHVSGDYLRALRQSIIHLNLFLDEAIDVTLREVQAAQWYPLARLQETFAGLARTYLKSGPILEQIGVQVADELRQSPTLREWFADGLTFLHAHQNAHLFAQLFRTGEARIGALSLLTLNPHDSVATVHSTTPFSRDFERGFLRGGVQAGGHCAVVNIEQTPDGNTFQIDFVLADATAADVPTSEQLLPGLSRRYQALEYKLERQTAFAEAVTAALYDTLHQHKDPSPLQPDAGGPLSKRTAEAMPTRMLDLLFDATITINETSEVVAFSQGAEQLFGYQSSEVVGQPLDELIIPPYLRQRHRDGLARCLHTGQTRLLGRRLEIEAMHADGHIVPIEMSVQEVQLASQRGFTAYLRDITERERMERALRESEQRFRSMAEANPVPMGIVGVEDLRWLYVSPSLAALVGVPVTQLLGRPTEAIRPVSDKAAAWLARLMAEGAVDAYELTLQKQDGSVIPIALTAKRIVYEGADAILGGIMDLTERKRTEDEMARQREALYQSEKLNALGTLLAGIAHELNNPLSVVMGRAIMLAEDTDDPETAIATEKIRQAAERCTQIVRTFLAIARQQPPEREPVNLNELLTSALSLVSYSLRTAGVEVKLDLALDLPALLADAVQLRQVFMNLLVNAQQALLETPEPRRLQLTTYHDRTSDLLHAVVSDNGPGVPAEIRSRIFDPFFTIKPMGVGTGVGLSLSHGLVTAHRGTIAVEEPPAGGARFVVTLPLAPPSRQLPQASPKSRTELSLIRF